MKGDEQLSMKMNLHITSFFNGYATTIVNIDVISIYKPIK